MNTETADPATKGQKILVVEDELPLAEMLSDKLQQEGFQVQIAGDGEEGLKQALTWQPNLILLDLVMPKMDGMTMLHKLREQEVGKLMPVILLTNLSNTEKVYDAVAHGVHDFLVKADWDVEDIIREIKATLKAAQ